MERMNFEGDLGGDLDFTKPLEPEAGDDGVNLESAEGLIIRLTESLEAGDSLTEDDRGAIQEKIVDLREQQKYFLKGTKSAEQVAGAIAKLNEILTRTLH